MIAGLQSNQSTGSDLALIMMMTLIYFVRISRCRDADLLVIQRIVRYLGTQDENRKSVCKDTVLGAMDRASQGGGGNGNSVSGLGLSMLADAGKAQREASERCTYSISRRAPRLNPRVEPVASR